VAIASLLNIKKGRNDSPQIVMDEKLG
jgi:hypothetical protein